MRISDVSDTERAVVDAFGTGAFVDVGGWRDRVVRSEVIRFLLLGGATVEAGNLPALRLTGAHITGDLEAEHADITVPISLHECRFDEPMSFFGSHVRRLSLQGSTMPGLMAFNVTFDASLRLVGCRSTGKIVVGNTQISGALILDGAQLPGSTAPHSASAAMCLPAMASPVVESCGSTPLKSAVPCAAKEQSSTTPPAPHCPL